jgi:hypothetical protein
MIRRLGALAAVLLAVASWPPTVRAQAAPACVPGGPPVSFAGHVTSADTSTEAPRYLLQPFQVAAGTTRVEVTYDWSDDPPALPGSPLTQTVFDLGLWDDDGYRSPAGFRGWSGSRVGRVGSGQPPAFVQQDTAERGYVPGVIKPGTWYVEIGVAAVTPSPAGATWTATVTCSSPAVGAPFVAQPVDRTHVANPNPGWYHGDFHMHGFHSNNNAPDWPGLVDLARGENLDFLPITDYVTGQHGGELGPVQEANPDLVIWPGREIITYYGHANALGETPGVLEYRHGFEDVTLRAIQAATRADGALFQVNHPTIFPGPVFANFCRGCEFQQDEVNIDWDAVDTMEVLTGPALVSSAEVGLPGLPVMIQNPFMQPAIDLWEEKLMAGHRITAVSGSDSKGVDDPDERERLGHGSSATAVYARQLSRPALMDAVRAGHAYVRTLGVDESPALELTATTADGQRGTFGDRLVADTAQVTVTVTGGEGQLLLLSRNGEPTGLPVPIDADPFTHVFTADRSDDEGPLGTFWRVDTQTLSPAPLLTTIGNPIVLGDAIPPGPGNTGAPTAARNDAVRADNRLAATGGGDATPAVLVLVLALAARRITSGAGGPAGRSGRRPSRG